MSKLLVPVGEGDSKKEYIFEFTRKTICEAEEEFGTSLLTEGEGFNSYSSFYKYLMALMYAGLVKNQPTIKKEDVENIYEDMTGEYGEEEFLVGIRELLEDALNPKTGGKKKKFPKRK